MLRQHRGPSGGGNLHSSCKHVNAEADRITRHLSKRQERISTYADESQRVKRARSLRVYL